ncbi:MAG: hypothetical protein FWD27_06135 [Coriobacteriia bacterium]|nr:hypothetical protein [Coriobacteriia bacterium]
MKSCQNCDSVTFDDMEMCYDCMSSFAEPLDEDKLESPITAARLQIAMAGYFNYELLLQKLEGCSLSVGSATENAIVIPQEQVATRLMEVFYAHGQIWAESTDTSALATIDTIPLCGTVRIQPGTEIIIGDATITLLEA